MTDQSRELRLSIKRAQLQELRALRIELLKLRVENYKIRNRAIETQQKVQEKFLNEGILGVLHKNTSEETKTAAEAVEKSAKLIQELGLDKE